MKRATNDADSSDDEVLMYSNKQKLTFSTNIGFDNLGAFDDSSSDSSSSEEDSDEDGFVVLKNKTNTEEVCEDESNSAKKRKIVPDVSLLSPSPPPPMAVISKTKKPTRKTRKIQRDTERLAILKNQLNNFDNDSSFQNENDDELFLYEEVSNSLKLKIRVHGVVEKYDVKKTDPLMILIAAIAKKENVDAGRVTLNWGSKSIDPDETTMKLGLTIADILECFIHENIAEKENTISVKVQSAKKSGKYEVKLSESVEGILKDFCEKNGADISKVRFSFDGEKIVDLQKTFSELDVIDCDVIDADIESS